jgi:hypothetical protein
MLVYQDITGYNKSIIDFDILIDSAQSGFKIVADYGTEESGLINSGVMFSGYNGYIFDRSGDFIGGYRSNKTFKITTHFHDSNYASYYIDGVLIKNNINVLNQPNRIEFDKHGNSSIAITHKGISQDYLNILADSAGIILISSDNIVLTH